MKEFVSINENFLDEELFKSFSTFAKVSKMYDLNENDTFWSKKVIHLHEVIFFGKERKVYANIVRDKIKEVFELEQEIYPDLLCITKWLPETSHGLHAPSQNLDGTPNDLHWRRFGAILFLNEDYDGGEIYFPKQNITINPKQNTLLLYPGTAEFVHEKRTIKKNIRYIIDSFWTFNKAKNLSL